MATFDPSDAQTMLKKGSLPAVRISNTADKFFKDFDTLHLRFKFPERELSDLQRAVYELIVNLLKKVEEIDTRFKCSDIVKVGSFEESTKILEPNEFDFLVVVEELSKKGNVEALRVCKDRRGNMHLRVKDSHLKKRWSNFIQQDELLGFVHGYNRISDRDFSSTLMDIYRAHSISAIETKSGKLELAGATLFHEPNTELFLRWTSHDRGEKFQISVDVSPAVRCYNIEDAVTFEDCPDENMFKEVCDHGSFLLTPGSGNTGINAPSKCFRISMTEVEVKIMLKLSPKHKICYRVLKFFFKQICKTPSVHALTYCGLSSYCLKTAVLHHLRSCSNTNQETIHACMESVVLFLLDALDNDMLHQGPVLPSIFIKDHNLFEMLSNYQTNKWVAFNLVMHAKGLLLLRSLVKNLGTIPSSDYCYNSCLKMLNDTISHMETSKNAALEKANKFVNSQGHWEAMVTVKDLLAHFDGM